MNTLHRLGQAGPSKYYPHLNPTRIKSCDRCRKKRIRCDSSDIPIGDPCTNCAEGGANCTHDDRKRGNKEVQVAAVSTLVDEPIASWKSGLNADINDWRLEVLPSETAHALHTSTTVIASLSDSSPPAQDDADTLADLLLELRVSVNDKGHFYGKSSGYSLIQAALNEKAKISGTPYNSKETWAAAPWEATVFGPVQYKPYIFPEDDLFLVLIDLYFTRINPFYPLLHRQRFEASLTKGLHYSSPSFGAVVLAVCAVASRSCDDPRVLQDSVTSENNRGWKYYEQIAFLCYRTFSQGASLFELQLYPLCCMYISGTSQLHQVISLMAFGIAHVRDTGGHRLKPGPDAELWGRLYWVFYSLDRMMSSQLGRPLLIQDSSFDVPHPLEFDDEYIVGVHGRVSTLQFFRSYLSLLDILGLALETIYALSKPKYFTPGMNKNEWQKTIVQHLDSSLNQWKSLLPHYLLQETSLDDAHGIVRDQIVVLWAVYNHVVIQVHRPSVKDADVPSLLMCTTAARSIIDSVHERTRVSDIYFHCIQYPLFASGIVLLVNASEAAAAGRPTNVVQKQNEQVAVLKCLEVFHSYAAGDRFQLAVKYMRVLMNLSQLPSNGFPLIAAQEKSTRPDITEQKFMELLQQEILNSALFAETAPPPQQPASPNFTGPVSNLSFNVGWSTAPASFMFDEWEVYMSQNVLPDYGPHAHTNTPASFV